MSSSRPIILFVYNSFNDPLFKGLLLTYLKSINKEETVFQFHIVTYEQKKYALTSTEKEKVIQELKEENIFWYPLTYHTGKFILLKKGWDFIKGFFLVLKLKMRTCSKVLLSFTNIAGAIGFVFSRILNLKFIVFSYEPHSEFLADLGLWSRNSFKYKCLNKLENIMGRRGEYIITGTHYLVNELKAGGAKGKVFRIPSCVDEEKLIFNETGRGVIRTKYNVGTRPCLIYVGKFGGLYYKEEIPLLFKRLLQFEKNLFFLVVTPQELGEVEGLFIEAGINNKDFAVTYSPYEEIQNYISAADIGLVAIKPTPYQQFRSPVKTGEYLTCGIPYIVCEGISEDDIYAINNNVGIVVENFETANAEMLVERMNLLFSEDPKSLRKRCREIGIEYRGVTQAIETIKIILEEVVS